MQSWSDVLEYIKINFGVLNKLEISDDEIVKNLRNHVLPFFSQYSGSKKFKAISDGDMVIGVTGDPIYKYKIKLEPEEYIIDILNIYYSRNGSLLDYAAPLINSPDTAIDVLIYNSYTDIIKSMQMKNTWDFLPPNILVFDAEIGFGIIEYTTVHSELKTIESDKYHLMFKKLCLANVKIWISANRSKFENLTTPFGVLNLNWEAMKAEGIQEREEVVTLLGMIPPDWLLNIDV